MRVYNYIKRVNTSPKLFGVRMSDMIYLMLEMVILFVAGAVIKALWTDFTFWYFLFVLLQGIGLYTILYFANKKDHPSFLMSYIAKRFFQPRRITFYKPVLRNEEVSD